LDPRLESLVECADTIASQNKDAIVILKAA
jgi:hypothetical protein